MKKKHIADVLIPANNEAAMVGKTIQSIASQNLQPDWRFTVHVIANGCTDDTVKVAKQTIDSLPAHPQLTFEVHDLPVASKIKALNFGLKRSQAPLVFCIDADSILSVNCFAATLSLFDNPQIMVGGPLPQLIIGRRHCKGLLGQLQRTANICNRLYECTTPSGCMIAFRRTLIDEYPTTIVADDTWVSFYAAYNHGWESVKVTRDARVYIIGAQQWLDYFKQESRFVRSTTQLLEVFPEFYQVRKEQIRQVRLTAKGKISKVKTQLKRENVKLTCLKQRQFFQQICTENAALMAGQLVTADGHWDPVLSTKQTPAEPC